jgi:hypothetical protein
MMMMMLTHDSHDQTTWNCSWKVRVETQFETYLCACDCWNYCDQTVEAVSMKFRAFFFYVWGISWEQLTVLNVYRPIFCGGSWGLLLCTLCEIRYHKH